MKTNVKTKDRGGRTHEGARAMTEKPLAALRRVLMAHMLYEDSLFYIDGQASADALVKAVYTAVDADMGGAAALIVEARTQMNIRHASLLAAVKLAEYAATSLRDDHKTIAKETLMGVMQRADEPAEVLAMAGGKKAPHVIVKAVRAVLESDRWDEYQLSKWKGNRNAYTLKDVVRLTHPRSSANPLIAKIADDTLETPNTWETRLSAGEDKRTVFESLLAENKLGAMALLRNLRNMDEAGVDRALITQAFDKANWSRVLPFRFMSAVLTAPKYARLLDAAFAKAVTGSVYLPGATAVMVDTSGSMGSTISAKSMVKMYQAGAVLGAAINGDQCDLYEWASSTRMVPNFGSLSSAMSLGSGAVGHGTDMRQALNHIRGKGYDRVIVIGDMQFNDAHVPVLEKGQKGYTINLSPYTNAGLMAGKWTHLSGFSSAVLTYIAEAEKAVA